MVIVVVDVVVVELVVVDVVVGDVVVVEVVVVIFMVVVVVDVVVGVYPPPEGAVVVVTDCLLQFGYFNPGSFI